MKVLYLSLADLFYLQSELEQIMLDKDNKKKPMKKNVFYNTKLPVSIVQKPDGRFELNESIDYDEEEDDKYDD